MTTTKSLEEQLHELQNKYKSVQKENEEIRKQYEDLKNEKLKDNPKRSRHDNEFWMKIKHQLSIGDTDPIKLMIKNKSLGLNDITRSDETILILASAYGCYDICQLCINSGAILDARDDNGRTAIDRARRSGFYKSVKFGLYFSL